MENAIRQLYDFGRDEVNWVLQAAADLSASGWQPDFDLPLERRSAKRNWLVTREYQVVI
jgi:hypothetical protein